jgi:DNA-binding transcriptional LysR family regulator
MLDLTHVRSFIAVAEEMHFGRAAARLNLSQSPLSRQVQMLEQSLGVSLLGRTTRAVRLTPAGRTFLKEAYRVIEAVESAEALTRRVASGEAGLVRLGFTAASAYQTLPRLVASVRAAMPCVDLVLEEMVTAEQIEALAMRRLDLGLLRPSVFRESYSQITTVPLLHERLLLAIPQDHVLSTGRRPVLEDLDDQPFVTWAPGGGSYFLDLLARLFHDGGVRPRTVQQVNQTHTMLALVGAGLGLALVPEAARSIRMSSVVLRPIKLPKTAQAALVLAWREDNDNPALPRLRAIVLAAFSKNKIELAGQAT